MNWTRVPVKHKKRQQLFRRKTININISLDLFVTGIANVNVIILFRYPSKNIEYTIPTTWFSVKTNNNNQNGYDSSAIWFYFERPKYNFSWLFWSTASLKIFFSHSAYCIREKKSFALFFNVPVYVCVCVFVINIPKSNQKSK